MLELRSLSKRLGSLAISDLDLCLPGGEYFVLLGPSGVGKTVLIEVIAGLIPPDAGAIMWEGRDITLSPPEARGFSVVYQDCALFPHMTVAENIAYGLRVRGVRRSERLGRVGAMAEMLDIEALLDRHTERLSGGEQQRVALARALVTDPPLLRLDEPLSSLDSNTRVRLRKQLKRVHDQTGGAFLHVTHDADEAAYLGDRVGVMLDSRLRCVGTSAEVFWQPSDREVAEFLGMRNVMTVKCVRPGVCETCGVHVHAASADESTSHIWIKPEEILLSKQPFDSSARNQFRCQVREWEPSGGQLAVRVSVRHLALTAIITHQSFVQLGIKAGTMLYCTFKSSAVHCF